MDELNDWQEALEHAIASSGHERYRWLCSDENVPWDGRNGRDAYRRRMVEKMQPDSIDRLDAAYAAEGTGRALRHCCGH
jgi:hypothetical protein